MKLNFTLIAQAIAFAILIWFTIKFVWPPLLNAIEKRQKEIADGLAAAQEGKLSLEVAAKKNAESLNEEKQKGDRIITSAKSEIDQEINRAKEDLRTQVSTLAIAGAEKILSKEIDKKAHADMLSKLAKDL